MSIKDTYPAGVPCWIDTFQPDPDAAARFYGALLGWTFDEPTAMPDGLPGEYRIARSGGLRVAGIGQAPEGLPSAIWTTYIAADDVTAAADTATAAGAATIVPPTGHGELGPVAVLTDPTGVAFGIRASGAGRGAERVNEASAWTMSSLHSPDPDGSEAFYGAIFGWSLARVADRPMAFWQLDGYVGGGPGQAMPRDVVGVLTPILEGDPTPPHWSVAVAVRDVDATAQAATELGGTVLFGPMDTPGFRSAVIADPQGGVVAFLTPVA